MSQTVGRGYQYYLYVGPVLGGWREGGKGSMGTDQV